MTKEVPSVDSSQLVSSRCPACREGYWECYYWRAGVTISGETFDHDCGTFGIFCFYRL